MHPTEGFKYSVRWSDEQGMFVGTVLEMPSLSHRNEDPVAAFRGIWSLAREVVDDFQARGEWVPEPLTGDAEAHAHAREAAYRMLQEGQL